MYYPDDVAWKKYILLNGECLSLSCLLSQFNLKRAGTREKSRLWVSIIRALCRASPVTIRNSTRNLTDQIITFISFVLSTLWRGQVLTITNICPFNLKTSVAIIANATIQTKGLIATSPFWRFHYHAKLRQCATNSEFPFWRNFACVNLRSSLSLLLPSTLFHK